ncbi:hypothetical protein Tco_0438734 [Tanacetum coccineum]
MGSIRRNGNGGGFDAGQPSPSPNLISNAHPEPARSSLGILSRPSIGARCTPKPASIPIDLSCSKTDGNLFEKTVYLRRLFVNHNTHGEEEDEGSKAIPMRNKKRRLLLGNIEQERQRVARDKNKAIALSQGNGVHRDERESSRILLMGRPKESIIIFTGYSVLLNGRKDDRVMLAYAYGLKASQEPVTEYRVLGPTISGSSWLKLCPLTNHKHQGLEYGRYGISKVLDTCGHKYVVSCMMDMAYWLSEQ